MIYDPRQRESVYTDLVQQLDQDIEHGLKQANPLQTRQQMKCRGLFEMLKADRAHQSTVLKRLRRQLDSLMAYCLFRLGPIVYLVPFHIT